MFDKVRIGLSRTALRLIAEITCSVNYVQQVTNYWLGSGQEIVGLFPFVNNFSHFHDILECSLLGFFSPVGWS